MILLKTTDPHNIIYNITRDIIFTFYQRVFIRKQVGCMPKDKLNHIFL